MSKHTPAARHSCKRVAPLAPGTTESACTICGRMLPRTLDFYFRARFGDGMRRQCKECCNAQTRARHAIPSKKRRHHDRMRQNTFGLTAEDYLLMLNAQGGVCAICGKPEMLKGKGGDIRNLAVDHDHQTGAVRGLLCGICNTGLASFRESIHSLARAIVYLEEYRSGEVQG